MDDTRPIAVIRWLEAERQNDPLLADLLEPAVTSVLLDKSVNEIEFIKMGDMWKLVGQDENECPILK